MLHILERGNNGAPDSGAGRRYEEADRSRCFFNCNRYADYADYP